MSKYVKKIVQVRFHKPQKCLLPYDRPCDPQQALN